MSKILTILKCSFILMLSYPGLTMDDKLSSKETALAKIAGNYALSKIGDQKSDFCRWMSDFPIDDTPFEEHRFFQPITRIAAELSCFGSAVLESSAKLCSSLLLFPKESELAPCVLSHIQQLIDSDVILKKTISNLEDNFAVNEAEKLLCSLGNAVEKVAKPSRIVEPKEVPEKLKVNETLIPDPYIMLYNLMLKGQDPAFFQLAVVDNTLEMKVALILAELRESLLQKLIPADQKNRACQERFIKMKLWDHLGLVGRVEDFPNENVDIVYKRMTVSARVFMDYIVRGTNDKFDYQSEKGKSRYSIPIRKGQGYNNPQVLIDYVLAGLNNQKFLEENFTILGKYLQLHYGHDGPQKIGEYYSVDENRFTLMGVRALLYSLGYLESLAK